MTEFPLLPRPHRDETMAAADPGQGAPEPAPGFGIGGEDPDVTADGDGRPGPEETSGHPTPSADEPPFRTPDPDDVGRR